MMEPLFLLDTDTCIYLLNGNEFVKKRVERVGVKVIAVSIVTLGELYFGAYYSKRVEHNLKQIRGFFSDPCPELMYLDRKSVDYFGKFKAELRRKGKPVGDIDLLIAGIAVSRNLTLVTNNIKHFERIPDIAVENWFSDSSV